MKTDVLVVLAIFIFVALIFINGCTDNTINASDTFDDCSMINDSTSVCGNVKYEIY